MRDIWITDDSIVPFVIFMVVVAVLFTSLFWFTVLRDHTGTDAILNECETEVIDPT